MGTEGTWWGWVGVPWGSVWCQEGAHEPCWGDAPLEGCSSMAFTSSCAAPTVPSPCVLPQVGLSCHPRPCSSPALQAQTGGAPRGLLLAWVGSWCPFSMDSSWRPRSPGPFGVNSLQLLTSSPLPPSPQECRHGDGGPAPWSLPASSPGSGMGKQDGHSLGTVSWGL